MSATSTTSPFEQAIIHENMREEKDDTTHDFFEDAALMFSALMENVKMVAKKIAQPFELVLDAFMMKEAIKGQFKAGDLAKRAEKFLSSVAGVAQANTLKPMAV